MKIATKERLVTGMGLAAIGIIAAMIWWTYSEVEYANRQRRVTSEIARGLTELKLVTFEYHLYHNERVRAQWYAVSDRVDRLVASARFRAPEQTEILAGLREKRAVGRSLFAKITAESGTDRADAPLDDASRRFEAQLLSQLLTYQQDNFTDAFRLNDLATERINDAQRQVMIVILAGLALIASITVVASWFLRRDVLAPIARLQQATRQVAAGNWDFILGVRGDDEIGELSKNFDAMTQSLRKSFAQAEQSNQDLAALNDELELRVRERTAELVQSNKSIQSSEARMAGIVNSAMDAIISVNAEQKIVLFNAAAENMFGCAALTAMGQAIDMLIPQRFRDQHRHHIGEFGKTSDPHRSRAMRSLDVLYGLRANGQEFPLEASISQIEVSGHKTFTVILRDITEREEAAEKLRRLNADLEQNVIHRTAELAAANKELEAFSYSVAHDLRGPLRSMDGFSLVLIEDYGDKLDDEGKDALERIRAASQRMGYLIDDMLRLSRVTRAELKVTRVDLSAIAREIADALDREPSGRSVEWAIEPGLSIRADPALMRIVMQNLLQNAWKFTGKTDRPAIRVGVLERDAKKVYFVADNGAGFDMAHADNLFGAFQRLHHVGDFPGTGIGLAIVQRIIRRHDGEIWAQAKVGEGATFFFIVKESENGSDEQDHPAG